MLKKIKLIFKKINQRIMLWRKGIYTTKETYYIRQASKENYCHYRVGLIIKTNPNYGFIFQDNIILFKDTYDGTRTVDIASTYSAKFIPSPDDPITIFGQHNIPRDMVQEIFCTRIQKTSKKHKLFHFSFNLSYTPKHIFLSTFNILKIFFK